MPLMVLEGMDGCGKSTQFDLLVSRCRAEGIPCAAYRDPDFVREAVNKFGSEKIIVALDADRQQACASGREVYIDRGRTPTGKDAIEFAREMADIGVGQILPTSKATDGTLDGYDVELTRQIAEATGRPGIASGGAGKLAHFSEVVKEGRASAVLAASVFHFGTFSIRQVKEHLRDEGIPVKL